MRVEIQNFKVEIKAILKAKNEINQIFFYYKQKRTYFKKKISINFN